MIGVTGVQNATSAPAERVIPLKHIARVNVATLDDMTDPDYSFDYIDISSVTPEVGIARRERVTFGTAPSRARRKVTHGDTIVSTVRTYLRAVAFVDEPDDLVVSTGFAVLSPGAGVDPRYLYRAVQSKPFVDEVVARSTGVSYPAINPGELGRIGVHLPDACTQRAIADFLDRETERIDALVAKKQRLIELLQEKRTALISHAVTKGLDPDVPMKDSGLEWLGLVPAAWAVAPVYSRYEVQLGKMLDTSKISGDHLRPFVRNVDVQWDGINMDDLPMMDFDSSDRARFALKLGDLLVCEGGEVGKAALWTGDMECYYQKALHRLRPRRIGEFPRFVYYVLLTAAKRGVFVAGSNQNTIDHLTAEKLRRHRFAFPEPAAQRGIAEYLDRETQRVDRLIGRVREAVDRIKEYRSALITAAVTGQIDVRTYRREAS